MIICPTRPLTVFYLALCGFIGGAGVLLADSPSCAPVQCYGKALEALQAAQATYAEAERNLRAQVQAEIQPLSEKLAKLQQVYVSGAVDISCGSMLKPTIEPSPSNPEPYNIANGFGVNYNKCYVPFPRDFENATVYLGMIGFNIAHSSNYHQNNQYVVNLSVADVSSKGFNVQVASNTDEVIFSVRVAYIAFYQP